jgi:hypothetical protein
MAPLALADANTIVALLAHPWAIYARRSATGRLVAWWAVGARRMPARVGEC